MKAVQFHRFGDSSVLQVEEVPTPAPGEGQVLIRVAAAGVNPADRMLRAGLMQGIFELSLPHIPCIDVSGTVVSANAGVEGFEPGDRVAGFLPVTGPGAAAEYAVAPMEVLARVPEEVDLVEAAALPGSALTAWQAVVEHAGVQPGHTVLVNGAGGSVGGYVVQIAHRLGAVVTASASPRSADRVRALGADEIIDHTQAPVTDTDQRFDAVINLAPASPNDPGAGDALAALTVDGGTFVSATTAVTTEPGRGVRAIRMASHADGPRLAELLSLVRDGALRIHPTQHYGLDELAAVHERADRGESGVRALIVP